MPRLAFINQAATLALRRTPNTYASSSPSFFSTRRPPAQPVSPPCRTSMSSSTTPKASPPSPSPPSTTIDPATATELAWADAHLASVGFDERKDKVCVFDGVCVMCNRGVDFVLRFDTAKQFKYAALQSDSGRALSIKYGAPRDLSTMVYVEGGEAHVRSEAVLRIGANLFPFAPAATLAMTFPRPMRDWLYTNVLAENRYQVFGKRDTCRLVEPGMEDRFL